MLKITDTHAHYDDKAFDGDREELLPALFDKCINKIVTVGCSVARWQPTLALTQRYEGMYGTLGLHPEDIDDIPDDWDDRLRVLLKTPKIKALGEIGLDYHSEGFDREKQQVFFRRQLSIARELAMPVVIHSRDATEDMMTILREERPEKAVVHCFSGSVETARELVKMGLYISFTGVLTFKNGKKAVSACEAIPNDRLMLETDCPYLSPVPHRGKRCDSSMLRHTAAKMSGIKGLDTDEMIEICNENAERFFGI